MTHDRKGKRGRASPNPPRKRRRGGRSPDLAAGELRGEAKVAWVAAAPAAPQPSLVMVTGLPPGCSVLELKSRLEAYGAVARTRVDAAAAAGYAAFRSDAAAEAAIAASLDPDGGITVGFKKVLVVRATEAPMNWKTGVPVPDEEPLHTRTDKKTSDASAVLSASSASQVTYKGREIVAYDDLF